MHRVGSFFLLACLTLAALYSTEQQRALAQGSSAAPPGYDEAIDTALQEFDAGNFAEARSQFLRAHGIFPNARTLRALGKSEYELKNYAEACTYFEQALDSKIRPLTNDQRNETMRLLEASRGYTRRFLVTLRPANTKLILDGNPVVLGPQNVLVLKVGDHTLEASADGFQSERRQLRVAGGGSESLAFDLRAAEPVAAPLPEVALPESEPAPAAPAPIQSETTPLRKKWWFWTGIAMVAAGGAVAAFLLTRKEPGPEAPSVSSTGVVISVPASTAK